MITDRSRRVDWSGIRAVSALARERPGAVNLSIGQPEFAIPEACKRAAISAIEHDQNGYTPNPGLESLRGALSQRLARETG
ncbi:MAG: aspartate aminotransferase, partial [Planctomyces sp.]